MRKKLAAAAVTLIMLIVSYGFLYQLYMIRDNGTPLAAGGRMDLSGWPLAEKGVVALDGEWEFYPGRLLGHEELQAYVETSSSPSPETMYLPSSWGKRMKPFGLATYRLHIRVDDGNRMYGLKTLSIQMANRILVNGTEIGSAGTLPDQGSYVGSNKPYVAYFSLQPGWNEIIVQVANYDYLPSSGIPNSIYFGYSNQISSLRDIALARDLISICSFFIMGMYFIGLYSQRKNDYSLVTFGLLCIFVTMFLSTRGERLLFVLFDFVPYGIYIRLQSISVYAACMSLFLFVYTAFRPFCHKWVIHTGLLLGVVLMITALVDVHNSRLLLLMTTFYATAPFLYATYVYVLAALHRVEGSLYLVVAAISLNYHSLAQSFNVYTNAPLYFTFPYEVILVLLMLALLMSLRFSNEFKKNEQLSLQLLKADKLKDDFLSKTSHEFKTPLHSIITISESMVQDARDPLPPEQQEKLELVLSISRKLSQLVLDILDLSKLKQGDLTVRPVAVDVRTTVDIVLRIFSFLTAGKPIALINKVPENLPNVLADENRFRQILNNLLDNAVKHTVSGSIEVSAAERDGMIEISVADTGAGIDPQALDLIFEPFQSFESQGLQSFGLGLPIVKQLIELQRGTIEVSSVQGEGTVFTISLPSAGSGASASTNKLAYVRARDEQDYSFPTPYYKENLGKHTILIVDDDFSNLKILLDALAPTGCNVVAVKNGLEAVAQIDKPNAVDLVVLDLMMPGMSGYEVCQYIRQKYTLLEMPVLMVTTAAQPQDKLAAFEAGANDFLPKPFDAMELKARIKGLLLMKESLEKAIELEVAFLQSQIKPHFLYNVLNTIIALSYTDEEQSRKLTTDLADYLRGSFRFSNVQKRTSFGQELNLIRSYVEIERTRFKDRLRIEYDIAVEMYGVSIPPLLIQPLVENAIRHGIGGRTEGGTVKIKANRTDAHYCIQIEDDGVGIGEDRLSCLLDPSSEASQGVGLKNIMKRLKYEYHSELRVDSSPGNGTKVTVLIPLAAVLHSNV
ncbi:ATP-binding protein [Paenibacillus doosanensis]|uniref:histidine kinase n=1 Tax=Paenibacillus konkukensis TaxID=2020716 RepID=A0ABY4RMH4_9BACL|nr:MULTISPECIES: ATP-binding protein [Paenibacillus]MCS7462393.1 ATP-binding protein [Paenibacillus doosanensis]UQZ83225.1 Autoinducer 2 sensor kinase/phosphatase LuxQ [Paenibacillus konkukensis]